MDILKIFIDFFLHIDKNLAFIINQFGFLTHAILFLIIFMETGFVVTPFLPGDSLLFAAGALSSQGLLNITLLWFLLISAAVIGDTTNYWIGHFIGPKAFHPDASINVFGIRIRISKILKQEYLHKAEKFYEKHGGKAVIMARFIPIVRTFAPFVSGVSKMKYRRFLSFSALGGTIWVSLFLLSGYFFGSIPFVQKNFHYIVVVIILISIVPILIEWGRSRFAKNTLSPDRQSKMKS